MLTHSQVWGAVDRIAARYNFSPSGLAKAAGLDPTTFNKSKRVTPDGRPRWPSTESVAKVLDATGASIDEFISLLTKKPKRPAQPVPLIGFAEAGSGGFFDDSGFPVGSGWDEIKLPNVDDDHAYVLVVSPAAPLHKGDRVVIKTRDGEVLAKELKKKTLKAVELKSLNPDHKDRVLPMSEVVWIARIVWATQ
jgi:phage repressor protein C with HTH and peptisase S24 domain